MTESQDVAAGGLFLTPPGMMAIVLGIGWGAYVILIAFTLYPASLLWNAFLHPMWGSLVWMAIPLVIGFVLGLAPLLSYVDCPRSVRVTSEGAWFGRFHSERMIEWSRFRRPIISMGPFGAIVRYATDRARHVLPKIYLNVRQAELLARAGRYEEWGWDTNIARNAVSSALEGRYRSHRDTGMGKL